MNLATEDILDIFIIKWIIYLWNNYAIPISSFSLLPLFTLINQFQLLTKSTKKQCKFLYGIHLKSYHKINTNQRAINTNSAQTQQTKFNSRDYYQQISEFNSRDYYQQKYDFNCRDYQNSTAETITNKNTISKAEQNNQAI